MTEVGYIDKGKTLGARTLMLSRSPGGRNLEVMAAVHQRLCTPHSIFSVVRHFGFDELEINVSIGISAEGNALLTGTRPEHIQDVDEY